MSSPPTPTAKHPARSLAALFAGAVAIGFAPIFVRLSELGPSATAFWRIALALPFLIVWAKQAGPGRVGPSRGAWPVVALAGIAFAGDLAIWHWSIHLTSVANATLEANLAAIFVTLIGWAIFHRKPTGSFLATIAIALAGTALLVGKNIHFSPTSLRGDALGLITAVFYSVYLLSVKAARDRGVSTGIIMAASGAITAALLWPVAWLAGESLLPHSGRGWAILAGLALISHLGGQSLIAYALAELPAAFASVGLLVQPATAALAAWALLGEPLSPGQLAGGGLLLLGIWLARRDAR